MSLLILYYHIMFFTCRQAFPEKSAAAKAAALFLLFAEGLAVGALIHGGIGFMGAYQDALQRAVVGVITMICALGDGTFDALVGMTTHSQFLLF